MTTPEYTLELRTDALGTYLSLLDDSGREVEMVDLDEHISTERLSVRDIRRLYYAKASEDITFTFFAKTGTYTYRTSIKKLEGLSRMHTPQHGEFETEDLEFVAGLFVRHDAFTVERCGTEESWDDE